MKWLMCLMKPFCMQTWAPTLCIQSHGNSGKMDTTRRHFQPMVKLRRLFPNSWAALSQLPSSSGVSQSLKGVATSTTYYCDVWTTLPLPLWHLDDIADLYQAALALFDFDHCVPHMKSHNYTNVKAWHEQSQVVVMTEEKKSGCFWHKTWHYRDDKKE